MVFPVVVMVNSMVNLDDLSTCFDITDVMTHENNTRTKKETVVINEALAKLKETIISAISCLKEKIINLKDIAIKRLQEVNKKLWEKCINPIQDGSF